MRAGNLTGIDQFRHRRAHFVRRGRRRQRRTEVHGHGIKNVARSFPEKFAALEIENAPPNADQSNRQLSGHAN
jgi:hypothetical protein